MRETWYIFDGEGNIVNEENGTADELDAISDFKRYFTEEEAREKGYTLCRVLEDDNCYYECLEELTADDIY